jgi:alpha-galactosidase
MQQSKSSFFLDESLSHKPVGSNTAEPLESENSMNAKLPARTLILAMLCCSAIPFSLFAQDQGLALTPPMGWNSWNHFAEKVNARTVRAQADAMVASGMKDAGYLYINIDDSWEGKRDDKGFIHANEKFRDMKALADYVHSKGLKLGIYSSPGAKTCAGFGGSLGHEDQDAQTYAAWGIDYLKYDWCQPSGTIEEMNAAYSKMHAALKKTGRPVVFSLCQYGWGNVWEWGESVGGNLWRTTGDIEDNYESMTRIGFGQSGHEKFAGPGHWNDPDMLEVGNGGMNEDEYRTHLSLWCILAAPLIAGNDLGKMTPFTLDLLTNREVLAVDQDPLGKEGYPVVQEGPFEVWMKPMSDGSIVVGLFNRSKEADLMNVSFSHLGISGEASIRDLWLKKDLGGFKEKYSVYVPSHGVVLVRITKK